MKILYIIIESLYSLLVEYREYISLTASLITLGEKLLKLLKCLFAAVRFFWSSVCQLGRRFAFRLRTAINSGLILLNITAADITNAAEPDHNGHPLLLEKIWTVRNDGPCPGKSDLPNTPAHDINPYMRC